MVPECKSEWNREAITNYYKLTYFGWPRSKLSKFRILSYLEIAVRGQNPSFQEVYQKMAVFEQLNDQLLVSSNKV